MLPEGILNSSIQSIHQAHLVTKWDRQVTHDSNQGNPVSQQRQSDDIACHGISDGHWGSDHHPPKKKPFIMAYPLVI